MKNIIVRRYGSGMEGWLGYVEPADLSWILFIDDKGKPFCTMRGIPTQEPYVRSGSVDGRLHLPSLA